MRRKELLKQVVMTEKYEDVSFKNTDVDLLYELYAYFLDHKDYSSARGIHQIFTNDKNSQLFIASELGEMKEIDEILMHLKTLKKNWLELVNKLDQIILTYIKTLIADNDLNEFKNALQIWDDTSQFHTDNIAKMGKSQEVCLRNIEREEFIEDPTRRDVFGLSHLHFKCLDLIPEILHNKGKDKWILAIFDKTQNVGYINNTIKNFLLDSKPSILEKSLYIAINSRKLGSFSNNDIRFYETRTHFQEEIAMMLEQKLYKYLPTILIELNDRLYSQSLFHVLDAIYKHDKNVFYKTLERIHTGKNKHEYVTLIALKLLLLKKTDVDYQFLINYIIDYNSKTYTEVILRDIQNLKIEQLSYSGDNYLIEIYNKKEYLYTSCGVLLLSSLTTSFSFDLLKFINKYELNFEDTIDSIFGVYSWEHEYKNYNLERILIKLYEYFTNLLHENKKSLNNTKQLVLSKQCLVEILWKVIDMQHTSEFVISCFQIIYKKISSKFKSITMEDVLSNLINKTEAQVIPHVHQHSYIDDLDQNEAYNYVQAAFLHCVFIMYRTIISDKNFNQYDFGQTAYNIFVYLKKFGVSSIKEPIPMFNNDQINSLQNLNDMIKAFINISEEEDLINQVLSDIILELLQYYPKKKEQDKRNEIIQARVEERDRIMAKLSHTVKNMIGTIIDPLENIKSSGEMQPVAIDNAIRGANLVRSLVNAMNLSFKGSIEDFQYDIQNADYQNATSLEQMFIEALKYSISSMFDGKYFNKFMRNYFPSKPIFLKAKQSWNEISQTTDLNNLTEFMNKYILSLSIKIEQAKDFIIGDEKGSSLKLLILIQEIIFNAVKYSSFIPQESRMLRILFQADKENVLIKVENKYKEDVQVKSSGLGKEIINNFSKLLQTEPDIKRENGIYSVEIKFKNLWEE